MSTNPVCSPPDASTGCVTVVEDSAAGCVQAASSTPASPEAIRPTTVREFERALRDHLGFSQREAAAIARSGFKAISKADDSDELDQLAALLHRNAGILKA